MRIIERIILSALIIMIHIYSGYSQTSGNITVLDANVDPGGIIDEFPLAPPRTIGSIYISDEWTVGHLQLINNRELNGYPLRYDLKNEQLEIYYNNEIKICPRERIKIFSLKENGQKDTLNFINTSYLIQSNGANHEGVMLLILDYKEVSLYKEYYLDVKEATYVPALDMGKRDNSILLKHVYYLVRDEQFLKLENSLKKNKSLFGDTYLQLLDYGKSNKLKLKKEEDLIQLIKYYETLL